MWSRATGTARAPVTPAGLADGVHLCEAPAILPPHTRDRPMQRRRFGRTGLEIPALTFGGGWVGGLLIRGSEQEREAVLNRALDAGIDWIDTAALYGNGVSETVIGGWLRGVPK